MLGYWERISVASCRVRTQRFDAGIFRRYVELGGGVVRTYQLLDTLLVCIRACCSETRSFVCICSYQDRYFGEFTLGVADLRVLGDEDVVDCGEPF